MDGLQRGLNFEFQVFKIESIRNVFLIKNILFIHA